MQKRYRVSAAGTVEPVETGMPSNAAYRAAVTGEPNADESPLDRRSFLKAAGFTLSAAAVAGCGRSPLQHVIPWTTAPEELAAGEGVYYASMCAGCESRCGMIVKNRDGRPIKLEGNPEHPVSRGGLCAVGQAQLLGLYDSQRLSAPRVDGAESTWDAADARVRGVLDEIASGKRKGRVRLLTGTVSSISTRSVIRDFLGRYPDARHVEYDPLSASAILDAHEVTHGLRVLPRYLFEKAAVILSLDADFLGTWISPVEFTAGWRARRTLEGDAPSMSRHIQIEPRLSLTGSNADERIPVAPSALTVSAARVAAKVAAKAGVSASAFARFDKGDGISVSDAERIAEELWAHRGAALVVCGVNDLTAQAIVNHLNQMLGAYGATLDIVRPSHQWAGSDSALQELLVEIRAGRVAALFIQGVNPCYDLPDGSTLAKDLAKVPLVVRIADRLDETSAAAHVVLPEPHGLESWDDAEAVSGIVTVSQPAIAPLHPVRSLRESLARWTGRPQADREIVRSVWRNEVHARAENKTAFEAFWNAAVHDGFAKVRPAESAVGAIRPDSLAGLHHEPPSGSGLEVVVYAKLAMLDGRHAHNPWLHELPDPISKVTWGNYAALAPSTAARLGFSEGDIVSVKSEDGNATIELPVQIQPGVHERAVAIAMGYGRAGTDRFSKVGPQWLEAIPTVAYGDTVGRNAAVLLAIRDGRITSQGRVVTLAKTGRKSPLAATQTHHRLTVHDTVGIEGREPLHIVQEAAFATWLKNRHAGAPHEHVPEADLWAADHPRRGARWGMAIDLTKCTGCSACVIACQAENNVPVVGADEVRRSREMHWIRLDRYYSGDDTNPEVVHQPMLCHHCDNAPCETVCPVLATVHSAEGLNQQVYNRCVGTRYCANNCPYKTRRFNWFDYPHDDKLQNMTLNPDVTVRSRGVMEKCSFCVQRIIGARAEAQRRGEPIKDGDVMPACAQSCPAQAIVFGDRNDKASAIRESVADPRYYMLFSELNVKPNVGYLTKIRNRDEAPAAADHERARPGAGKAPHHA
jgi:Fe-S-cluster-containing dehydrogenase component